MKKLGLFKLQFIAKNSVVMSNIKNSAFINNKFHLVKTSQYSFSDDYKQKSYAELLDVNTNQKQEKKFFALKYSKASVYSALALIFAYNQVYLLFFVFSSCAVYSYLKHDSNLLRMFKEAEDKFTEEKNPQINVALK